MPAVPVFMPDPVLARAAPQTSGGFDVLGLLAPARPTFRHDPVISPVALLAMDDALQVDAIDASVDGMDLTVSDTPTTALPVLADEAGGFGPAPVGEPFAAGGSAEALHWQELLERRYREGFEEGLTEGARLAADAAVPTLPAGEHAAPGGNAWASRDAVLLLESLSRALQPLLLPDDAATRFEPLKRLALHLAMELVRTELTVSPRVVEGLVLRSVQALQAADEAPLTVELHPQDLALLQEALSAPGSGLAPDAPLLQRVHWKEDPQLTRGSVRARSDVSTVEDLIQHRLATIIQDLRIQSTQWQQDEAALQAQLQAGGGDA